MPWKPLTDLPDKPQRVLLFYPREYDPTWDGADYGIVVGYFGGVKRGRPDWRQQGTNHDCFEKWAMVENNTPKLWAPLEAPI